MHLITVCGDGLDLIRKFVTYIAFPRRPRLSCSNVALTYTTELTVYAYDAPYFTFESMALLEFTPSKNIDSFRLRVPSGSISHLSIMSPQVPARG